MSQTNVTTKAATTKPLTENGKPELSNLAVKTDTPANESEKILIAPISERIKRFEELEKLLEKREQVSEAIDNLNDFYIAPTGDMVFQCSLFI